jgi:hypothetical protein
LFPSYVFVVVVAGWWSARWCPHVTKLILNGATPAVVADSVIDEIRSRERGGLVEPRKGVRSGDSYVRSGDSFLQHPCIKAVA